MEEKYRGFGIMTMKTKEILFDLETDGLIPHVSQIHCGVTMDLATLKVHTFGPSDIEALIEELSSATLLAGHNICGFDIPVLELLHGYDVPGQKYFDTLAMSRAIYPGSSSTSILRIKDLAFQKKYGENSELDSTHHGRHTLKAWSIRLRLEEEGKADYDGGWEKFSQEMLDYCERDVLCNKHLLDHLLSKSWPAEVHHVESMMTYLMWKQEQYGVGFDEDAAVLLMADLTQKRADLTTKLQTTFPPVEVPEGRPKQWKKNMTCRKFQPGEEGYFEPRVKGEWHQKTKLQEFNPASTQHISKRLMDMYDWEPQAFTPGGQVQVTDVILRDLPWPEAQQCADYQVVKKSLAYISEGKSAWLKLVKHGRLHGRVMPTGAVTNRASHSAPNLANVPSKDKAYGKECRSLFTAGGGDVPKDYVMVGCDASSLQLSIYAHYVARYDGGALAALCEDEDGDPHEFMRNASGLFYRENQKTLTYATWFGAQPYKQGTIVLADWRQAFDNKLTDEPYPGLNKAGALGKAVNARMLTNMKGFAEMDKSCIKAAARGYITALDGRRIPVSQERLALLTLLQGNEAVVMKHAYVLSCERLDATIRSGMAHPCLWIHDEFQWASEPSHAEDVGQILSECITEAGEKLGLRLKLGANYKVGTSWAKTH
jgi:hypothetical protein